MRKTTLVALLVLCAVFVQAPTAEAIAQSNSTESEEKETSSVSLFGDTGTTLAVVAQTATSAIAAEAKEQAKPAAPKKHTVAAGESLSKIAKQYKTDWQRIYAKNTQLKNPDLLNAGQKLTIPTKNEKLELRKLPVQAPAPVAAPQVQRSSSATPTSTQPAPVVSVTRGSSSGNTYYAGYCTWYAKSRRPDLPNNLGNASSWLSRAAAQGYATGSTPRAGAVAYALTGYMHVAYVESVNGDGTVTVSEMNYSGFGVVSSRTVSASAFSYIY